MSATPVGTRTQSHASTKALQIKADPARNMILESIHFLVEIGNASAFESFLC
jgi:hypothetical protein